MKYLIITLLAFLCLTVEAKQHIDVTIAPDGRVIIPPLLKLWPTWVIIITNGWLYLLRMGCMKKDFEFKFQWRGRI